MKKELVHFIAKHLPDTIETEAVPIGTRCAFSGERLTEGVPLRAVIKPATSNLADTFKVPSDYASVATAKCFKASRELRGNLFITEADIQHPMISAKSAKAKNRQTWRYLLTDYMADPKPAILILTDESKRRLWIDAAVSERNTSKYPSIRMFVNNTYMSRNIKLDVITLQQSLHVVQESLYHGFSKNAIRTTLYTHRERLLKLGLLATHGLEKQCAELRDSVEFSVALMIGTIDD